MRKEVSSSHKKTSSAAPGAGPVKRIALIEDDADIAYTIRLNLRKEKRYQVEHYVSGLAALAALQEKPFDLILLDLKLPKVDGLEVLRQIKGDAALKMIPVVMMTSSREEQDLLNSYQLGVNAYVVKPLKFNDFVEAVRQVGVFWAVINEMPPVNLRHGERVNS